MSHHPRHPDKHLRALCDALDRQGWTITRRPGGAYFKALCPCPERHLTMIHLMPDRHYLGHKVQWLRNQVRCWKEPGE